MRPFREPGFSAAIPIDARTRNRTTLIFTSNERRGKRREEAWSKGIAATFPSKAHFLLRS
jgi:hypothetical protein